MPYKDKERQREYFREYKKRNREKLLEQRRIKYREKNSPPDFWSAGHSDGRICLNCGGKAHNKPLKNCTEKRHAEYYQKRLNHHNEYRRRKRREARKHGETWGWKDDPRIKSRRQRESYLKLKHLVFDRLGWSCAICGFEDKRALQIDHVNGDGSYERKVENLTGTAFFRHLLSLSDEELYKRYQILCANCNYIKRCENEEF